MKTNFFLVMIILCFNLQSQVTVDKEFKIYFEDGIGNKDSVTILFNFSDDCANFINNDSVPIFVDMPGNAALGEIPLGNVPFDSIFEVRIAEPITPGGIPEVDFPGFEFDEAKYYKVKTLCDWWYEDENFFHPEPLFIIPNIKHLPLKMYWDFNWLKENGLGETWLTNNMHWFVTPNYDYVNYDSDAISGGYDTFVCPFNEGGDTLVFDTLFLPLTDNGEVAYLNPIYGRFWDEINVEGQTETKNIQPFLILFQQINPNITVCDTNRLLSSSNEFYINDFKVEVNITNTQIAINTNLENDFERLNILDLNGKSIYQSAFERNINITDLKSGLYIFQLFDSNGNYYNQKFMKY